MDQNDQVKHLVGEWEHGALSRREFLERAILIFGGLAGAEALLAACSPAVLPSPVPPTGTATTAATTAPTRAATSAPQATTTSATTERLIRSSSL